MIDPTKAPFYNLDSYGLEEFALFCIAVAGKTASVITKRLDDALTSMRVDIASHASTSAFEVIRRFTNRFLPPLAGRLQHYGIGCYHVKAAAMIDLAFSGLNLRKCSVADLESLHGIGPKTARFFILHTRRGAEVAVLDTHILKHLAGLGYRVPKSTPTGYKYREIERIFLDLAHGSGMTVAEYDSWIWNSRRRIINAHV